MLFSPGYTSPYLTAIDATLSNIFSCYINADGGSKVVAYNLFIKDLNGVQIYTSGKQTLVPGLYSEETLEVTVLSTSGMLNGSDYIWSVTLYETNPSMWVAYGVTQTGSTASSVIIRNHFNVKSGMYLKIGTETRKITTYVQSTGVATMATPFSGAPADGTEYTVYSDFISSEEIYFKARKTPVVSISNFISTVTSKQYNFIGSYVQNDNIGWKYFIWNLYNTEDEIIGTSGLENTGEINFNYNGFLKDTTYKIELIAESQDGNIATTGKQTFSVVYEETKILTKPGTEVLCEKDAIKIFWEQPYMNLSTVTGTTLPYYDYLLNEPYIGASSLNLHPNSQLIYNISTPNGVAYIPYESTTFIHCKFPVGFQGDILRQENTDNGDYYNLRYEDGSFLFDINGRYIGYIEIQPPSGTWLLTPISDLNPGIRYLWDDLDAWNDSYVWGEQTQDILSDNWWKFTLLPTNLLLTIIPIYHPNSFSPSGINMPYNTRIYNDYKLNKTDVLYK